MATMGKTNRGPELQRFLDLALDEQRSFWNRGESIPVEDYLARYPALRDDSEAILDLIYQEYLLRRQRGEGLEPDEFLSRFPDLADSLLLQFGIDAAIRPSVTPGKGHEFSNHEVYEYPRTVAGYEVTGELGRGGMGIVYKARDKALGRFVALKMIAGGNVADASQRRRFEVEARAAARLQHPNILQIHDIDEYEGCPFLVLEYAEGGSLADRLADKPQSPSAAAALVETLARVIQAAHDHGIVHRDLKPSNVLLTADGVPKIGDVGLAKLLDEKSSRTQSGDLIGTPSFMAPEQAEGHSKQVGPPADIYALGAILYQALTGRPPFLGESQLETLRLVTSTEAVSPRLLRPEVPRDLETICLKSLEKNPRQRYATAADLAEDLRRFLEGRPIAARPVGPVERLWRSCRRNPKLAGLAAALFLTFALGMPALLGLWLRARADRARAESEAEISKAVNEFLQKDMLAQASTYSQLRLNTPPDPDLKVRTALDRAAEHIGDRFAGQPLVEASIRQTIGGAYLELGLYPQARPQLERALELCRRARGDQDPDTLAAMTSLGSLYRADGKWAEAKSLLVPALEGLRQVRGLEHPYTLAAMDALAQLYLDQEVNFSEAESLTSQVREVFLRTRGASDLKTLDATNTLASVLAAQNNLEEAERLVKNVVDELTVQMTVDHPITLAAMLNLALIYEALGRKVEAEQLLKEVLGRQRKVLGNRHPHTLLTMFRLAMFYLGKKEPDKSEPLFIEAVEGCRAALDQNHQIAEGALAGLTAVYSMKPKPDLKKLGPVLIEARDITCARYGPDNQLAAGADQAVGMFFLSQQDYSQAEPYFREELAFRVKESPDQAARFLTELRLGVCLLAQRKYAEAKSRLISAYNGMKPREKSAIPANTSDLGCVIEQLRQLRDKAGQLINDLPLRKLRGDPALQDIIFDINFPADPFAP